MTASYIVRMDDACPSMRREIWGPLEEALDRLGIRPIIGVIPDNQDPSMLCSEPDPDFWERVRGWEKKGWSIALHGLHHTYHLIPPDGQALIPLHNRSEFVGLSLDKQRKILQESWRIFHDNGVKPSAFMAPSHTFDANTLTALLTETDIRIVTDGHALFPFLDNDFIWIPQQLWRFRWMPFGIWTVCLHPNDMSPNDLDALIEQLAQFANKMISLDAAVARCNERKKPFDWIFASIFGIALDLKKRLAG
jgi:predicted deacetylase